MSHRSRWQALRLPGSRCAAALESAALVTITVLIGAGCSSRPPERSPVARPVKTLVVTLAGGDRTRSFSGKAQAAQRAELAFQVSGQLEQLPVMEGQKVAEGDLIAQLRLTEFNERLRALQGDLSQARALLRRLQAGERVEEQLRRESLVRAAQARLENARIEHERNTRLIQTNAVSRAQFDLTATAYRVAQEDYLAARQLLEKGTVGREEDIAAQEAAVQSLEARVVEAQLQLSDATLRAPFSGVIARRLVEANESVRAKQPIVQFQNVDEIDVIVDVPETVMAADLRSADIVRLVAEFSGAPGIQFPVRIKEIAQVADPATQTFPVRVGLESPTEARILPGMSATVTLTYRRAAILGDRVLVPVSAISLNEARQQVAWLVGPDQIVRPRPVQLGAAIGGEVEILGGLAPGDRIAVAGVHLLRDGMQVRDLGDSLGTTGGSPR
ncbi:MAG: efflux RND transporter periplasmic adaptor subunit [Pirellulaceae bacterium]|nr:efflux RND transporter periplasmic adaptor subunit [Pirellulaceae bacterium]